MHSKTPADTNETRAGAPSRRKRASNGSCGDDAGRADMASKPGQGDFEPMRASRSISIVVPTYREAANIPALAERVHAALSGTGIEWELLLADDASDDGSEAVVAELARRLPIRMETRREPPRDLSRSVLFGVRRARFDRIVVMDADLSHPPERIVDMLRALDDGCDMALGSRYAPGGDVDRAWSPWRFLSSRLATVLARPLADCADPMSGFFAIDRRALPDPRTLRPVGYKIALELMVRGRLRVREVPIGFRDRHRGESKMGWRQQPAYLRHLCRQRDSVAMMRTARRKRRERRATVRAVARATDSPSEDRSGKARQRPESHGAAEPPAGLSRHDAPAVLGLAVLIAASYFPAFSGGFVWDDVAFSEEPIIHRWSGLWNIWFSPADLLNEGHYWPIVYTTFWLEHKLWGLAPFGYHLTCCCTWPIRCSCGGLR